MCLVKIFAMIWYYLNSAFTDLINQYEVTPLSATLNRKSGLENRLKVK